MYISKSNPSLYTNRTFFCIYYLSSGSPSTDLPQGLADHSCLQYACIITYEYSVNFLTALSVVNKPRVVNLVSPVVHIRLNIKLPCSSIWISQRTSPGLMSLLIVSFFCCIIDATINLPWQWNIPFKHETSHQLFRANIYLNFSFDFWQKSTSFLNLVTGT